MAIESIPIYGFVRSLVSWLPSFLLKRHYTAEILARLIYCDIQPRGDSVRLEVANSPTARLYLQLINLSPFEVELDRAAFQLQCGGPQVELLQTTRVHIQPGEIHTLCLQAPIQEGHADIIANSPGEVIQAWLTGNIEFNCSVRNFAKKVGCLSEIMPTIVNANIRKRGAA